MKNSLRRTLTVAAATTGLMGLGLAGAAAHVTVKPDTTEAGASSLLTFSFSHDCDGSPTNRITITLPDGMIDAKPEIVPGWDVEKVQETLDEPMTLPNGTSVTKRIGKIVYSTDAPVEDGYLQQFDVSVALPEGEDELVAFPTLQSCVEGETDWAQIPAEGEDPHSLDAAAPSFVLTAASAEDGHHAEPEAEAADLENASASTDTSGAATAGYVGLGAGLLGLAAGVVALLRTRKAKA